MWLRPLFTLNLLMHTVIGSTISVVAILATTLNHRPKWSKSQQIYNNLKRQHNCLQMRHINMFQNNIFHIHAVLL